MFHEERFVEATEILREAVTIKTSLNVSPESREHSESHLVNNWHCMYPCLMHCINEYHSTLSCLVSPDVMKRNAVFSQ